MTCEAIWQVLPAFIARHLWRTWRVVAHTLTPDDGRPSSEQSQHWPKVSSRTARRWRARWQRPAHALGQIFAASGEVAWAVLAGRLRPDATCADLVAAYAGGHAGPPVAAMAALIYRLQPKVRLM